MRQGSPFADPQVQGIVADLPVERHLYRRRPTITEFRQAAEAAGPGRGWLRRNEKLAEADRGRRSMATALGGRLGPSRGWRFGPVIFRVATKESAASVCPEVKLGLLPGAGGTQRACRAAVGPELAVKDGSSAAIPISAPGPERRSGTAWSRGDRSKARAAGGRKPLPARCWRKKAARLRKLRDDGYIEASPRPRPTVRSIFTSAVPGSVPPTT